jgi:hypothetical protein
VPRSAPRRVTSLQATDGHDCSTSSARSAAQLTAGGNGITPAFHLTDTSSLEPRMQLIAFDADGNGWVAESGLNQVVEFTAARILSAPVPHGLAFDNNGSVWVSNSVNAAIDVYSASTLTSGTAALIQRITPDLGQDAVFSMGKVAFDPWIVPAPAP